MPPSNEISSSNLVITVRLKVIEYELTEASRIKLKLKEIKSPFSRKVYLLTVRFLMVDLRLISSHLSRDRANSIHKAGKPNKLVSK